MKLFSLMLLCGAPLFALATSSTELVFVPEAGSTLTTTFERVLELELQDTELTLSLDGEEQEDTEAPDIELAIRETESIAFTDEFEKVSGGRVIRLSRSFDKLGTLSAEILTDVDGQDYETETPGKSELEATSVAFVWDEEAEEYSVRFADDDEDLDSALLEGLEASADLSWFLPEAEVEEGDQWEIDVTAFSKMASPSGDLKIVREGEEDSEDDFREQFAEHLEGGLGGELQELRSVEGRELAVIRVTGELETYVEEEHATDGEGGEGTSTERFKFTFEVEGELLWDVEAKHARSFQLSGEVKMTMESHEAYSGDGHSLDFTSTQVFGGTVKYDIRVE